MNLDSNSVQDQAGQSPASATATNGSAPPVTGPIGGPLPPAHMPLKPHLPPPEVSAVRDEEPTHPATAHDTVTDDPATASAAKAIVTSENMTNGQSASTSDVLQEESKPALDAVREESKPALDAVQEASKPYTDSVREDSKPYPDTVQEEPRSTFDSTGPAHDSDARGLNGSGIAQTSESQVNSATAAPVSQDTEPRSSIETQKPLDSQQVETQITAPPSAPGTQNPYNASEETAIKAEAPTTSEPAPVSQHNLFAKDEDVEMKDEKPNGITSAAVEQVQDPVQSQAQPRAEPQSSTTPDISDSRRPSSAVVGDDGSLPPLAGPHATEMSAVQIRACQNAIKSLKARVESIPFHAPVDPIALNVPHYFDIIKTPMDLGTADCKLALTAAAQKGGNKHTEKTKLGVKMGLNPLTDVYKTLEEVEKDVKLIFSNCVQFNGPEHPLSKTAQMLDGIFDKQMKSIIANSNDDNGADASAAALAAARRPSEGVAAARPKRDIHPPPPKDLPYADRPQSASGSLVKRKKSRGKMSAREVAFYEKLDKDQLKYALKVIDDFHHKPMADFAWVFFEKPGMDLDFSQAYYATIKNPISLKEIRERIVSGEYEDVDGPNNDMKLLIDNCFTFNAKGTDVYLMGEQMKSAWEDKLAKMPRPNPPVIDDDDDEDEDAEDDEDFEEEDTETRIFEIREQIASLQKELERLSGKAKQTKQKAASKKRRSSESGATKKAPAAKKAKSSGSGETKKGASVKKAGGGGGGRRDEEVREVTYEQKEELAAKITQLPDDRLDGALKIIAEDKPPNANDDEEIELDIDDLSPSTLYKLYRYVVRPKGKKVTTSKLSSSDGRKRGTGGVKRKNLDEDEEAARIARLQAQLNQFDNPNTSTSSASAPKPASKAAGHDDLVASDSSSGEEDYESESDYE